MIKCEWITCKFNSHDKEDHYTGANGECNCEEEIYLTSNVNDKCDSCDFYMDNLICKKYIGKKYGER
ncbi:hypothetical protein [Clostridium sp.]|uniref:hypothetical protein n=1 Tax=Clostridium sp. TaxID=1506 RepID=UPI001A3E59DF|nr:hypothetical protein [Clostridium sp.]MBK5242121.1 hypothetical protein [Clostridium sp.]